MSKPDIRDAAPGQIAAAAAAGFPPELLIPLCPPSATNFESPGKTPSRFGREKWYPINQWQQGLTPKDRDDADKLGCNVGLILGVPASGWQYLTVDVDTEPGDDPSVPPDMLAMKIMTTAVIALMKGVGAPIWMRQTRPGRASVLFRLRGDISPGVKRKGFLTGEDGAKLGAIELLARGQQTLIGGSHPWNDGTPVQWMLIGGKKNEPKLAFPTQENIPALDSRAKLDDLIVLVTTALNVQHKITTDYKRTLTTPELEDGGSLADDEQAPWDTQSFIGLFERMPHNERVDRDDYVSTMLAASAAVQAAERLKLADDTERRAMADAAISWAARWEDPKGEGTTLEAEADAWENDWSTRNVSYLGWGDLMRRAIGLGDGDIRYEWACRQFANDCVDAPKQGDPGQPVGSKVNADGTTRVPRRQRRLSFDVKESDIQIADSVQDNIGQQCAWVPETKSWVQWAGQKGGWTSKEADAYVRRNIEDELVYYVERHSESFGDGASATKAKLTSDVRVRAIENRLKDRLAKSLTDFDLGDFIVQTPGGAWDLKTGTPISKDAWEMQRDCYDRRMTLVAPKEGPTPIFDSILSHLAEGDQESIAWMWKYLGYCLLGRPNAHKVFILHGPGGNGKSKFANIPRTLLGTYAVQLDRKVVVKSGQNAHETGLYQARGKRLWCVSEIDPNEEWNESQIRSMSGGDPITARAMRQDMQTFRAEGALLIYTNYVPAFHRIDQAIIRRLAILHARMPVPEGTKDVNIEEKAIAEEGGAILMRIIQEAAEVYKYGLPEPPAKMTREAKRYLVSQDTFAGWFHDECRVVADDGKTVVCLEELHSRYMAWSKRVKGSAEDDDLTGAVDFLGANQFFSAIRKAGAITTTERGDQLRDAQGRKMARGVALKVAAVRAA